MSPTRAFQTHASFSKLVPLYDGFILDQFGVMHNGSHGLDGAPETVHQLKLFQKKLIILSNTSSSADATLAKLPKLGFQANDFVTAVTSGEEASRYIGENYEHKKALWITWKTPKQPSPMDFILKCHVDVTDKVEEADVIICHGADVLRGPGEDGVATETSLGSFSTTGDFTEMDKLLKKCLDNKIPMVCANPDFVMVNPDGTKGHMPGKIAQRYEEQFGGSVTSFGKPHVPHFEACLRELELPSNKVAHVGDSLHHDVAGANGANIDSVFVVGGIHREELGCELGEMPSEEALQKLFDKHGQTPTHVVPLLKM